MKSRGVIAAHVSITELALTLLVYLMIGMKSLVMYSIVDALATAVPLL